MTHEQTKRTVQAYRETRSLLEREMTYAPDLRHHDRVEFYEGHMTMLRVMVTGSMYATDDQLLAVCA